MVEAPEEPVQKTRARSIGANRADYRSRMHEVPASALPAGSVSILRAVPRLLAGLVTCGASVALMVTADLGLGPWDVLHQGIARRVGISIGIATILVGATVLMLWFPLRERPGVGTLTNVLVIGSTVDIVLSLLSTPDALWQRWAMLLVAVPLLGVGVGLYLGAGLGPGPRDGVMTGLAKRGLPIGVARTGIEMTALSVGWLLGGTVGLGTLYIAAGIGPAVHLAVPRLRAPWYPPGATHRVIGRSH
jgi:uncharacterized membrane protein YczE